MSRLILELTQNTLYVNVYRQSIIIFCAYSFCTTERLNKSDEKSDKTMHLL